MQSIANTHPKGFLTPEDLRFCRIANRHHKAIKRKRHRRRNRLELTAVAMCGVSAAFILGAMSWPDLRHRTYRSCGNEWNVSSLAPNEKKYICPRCEYQKRKSRLGTAIPKAARKLG